MSNAKRGTKWIIRGTPIKHLLFYLTFSTLTKLNIQLIKKTKHFISNLSIILITHILINTTPKFNITFKISTVDVED